MAQRLTRIESERLKAEYIEWLVLDKAARRSWGLPTSHEGFAELKDVTTRTLRRWRDDPEFDRKLAQRRTAVAKQAPNGAVAPKVTPHGPPKEGADEALEPVQNGTHPDLTAMGIKDPGREDYERFKLQLRDKALSDGSEKALELWMKWFGAPYMEAERAARESSFADMNDGELVDRTLTIIGEDAVREWLAARG